jgi:hypothetical protein
MSDPWAFADELESQEAVLEEALAYTRYYLEAGNWQWQQVLHVEETFTLTLSSGQEITHTPDLVALDFNDDLWVVDYKTTTSIPQDLAFPDTQAMLNCAGVHAKYPELRGFAYEYIRAKLPATPRLTKTGAKRVAYLETIDTTYEALYEFLRTEAPDLLDNEDHRRRLAELRDGPNRFHEQHRVFFTPESLESTLEDAAFVAEQIEQAKRFPRNSITHGPNSCNRCEFASLCRVDLLGQDRKLVLDFEFEARDTSYREYEGESV